jgi:hypothetical protein
MSIEKTTKRNKMEIEILNNIFKEFYFIKQEIPHDLEKATKHMNRAEGLINYLETINRSDLYGLTINRLLDKRTGYILYDRFLMLVKNYSASAQITSLWNGNLQSIETYFITLNEMKFKL